MKKIKGAITACVLFPLILSACGSSGSSANGAGASLASIAVTPADPSIACGTTQQFSAIGTYTDGSIANMTTLVSWRSSETGIATIDAAGLTAAVTAGTSTITASAGGFSGSTTLTVTSARLISLAISPANARIAKGTTQQFIATGTFSDSTTQDLTASVIWSSSSTTVLSISNAPGSRGLATSVAVGSSVITAYLGSISGSTTLTVTPAILASMEITPVNPSIVMGTAQQFNATGTFSDSTVQDITASARWSSSAPSVATMCSSSGCSGSAASKSVGTATITAASGGISRSTLLTITPASAPTGVHVVATAIGQVTLAWDSFPGALSYNLYWSSTAGVTRTTGTKISGITAPSYTHSNLTSGTPYYYVVTAVTGSGESDQSLEVSATASDLISVSIHTPFGSGRVVGKTIQVIVQATSFYQIQTMTAAIEDRKTDLVHSATAICGSKGCYPGWVGYLSLDGLARGDKLLTASATDYYGNIAAASVSVFYDTYPQLSITEPFNETVATPLLHIAASCIDDDPAGCKSITVKLFDVSGPMIASGTTSIDQIINLGPYASLNGTSVTLSFMALDSNDHLTIDTRTILIETSAKLVEVASVTGQIWDVQQDRMLYLDTSGNGNVLKIRDRTTGVDTVVTDNAGIIPQYGFLTPKGTIFVAQGGVIYDLRDGILADLGAPAWFNGIRVSGNFACWSDSYTIVLRDLVRGSNTTIAPDVTSGIAEVAANGDVVYLLGAPYQVYRYRGGVTTQLTSDSPSGNWYPLTDGINIVYVKQLGPDIGEIALYTASGQILLTPAISPIPYYSYAKVNNGWTAFRKPESGGVNQVWLRSPSGDLQQISVYSTSSSIDALGPNGDITWINGNRRYLTKNGSPPVDVGSSLGSSFYLGGQWYVIIGRTLFSVTP